MIEDSALSLLKDEELCIVTTKEGEREMRWNRAARCFFYLDRGTPVACDDDQIEEWRPASVRF